MTPYRFAADPESFARIPVQELAVTETCRTMRPSGLIQNVRVRLGISTIMVSEATARYKPMTAAYYRDVEDTDASVQQEPEQWFLEKRLEELGQAIASP